MKARYSHSSGLFFFSYYAKYPIYQDFIEIPSIEFGLNYYLYGS
ncbi:hypothetical protein SPPR111872_01595 [Sphingobacterium prati]